MGNFYVSSGYRASFCTSAKSRKYAQGFFTPILYAELLDNVAEAKLFLKDQKDPLFTRKMVLGNFLDFLFMLAYNLFLFYFLQDAHKLLIRYRFYSFLKFTPFTIGFFDFIETVVLLYLLFEDPERFSPQSLILLKTSSFLKWGLLGGFLFYLTIFLPIRGKLYAFLKYLSLPLIFFAISAFFYPPYLFEIFSLIVQLDFLLIYLAALFYRFRSP